MSGKNAKLRGRYFDALNKWYFYSLPAFVMIAFVTIYPVMINLFQSFFSIGFDGTWHFVGLNNFEEIIGSRIFYIVLKNTLIWTIGSVTGILVLGTITALLLNEDFKGRVFFRAILLLPWVIPRVIAGLLWKNMFHADIGIINEMLIRVGLLKSPVAWLGNPYIAIFPVMLTQIWQLYPFAMITILAGLQSIPQVLYEAAAIDGANGWQKFCYITVPQLFQVIRVIVLLLFIWAINAFDITFVMTRGGPVHSTELLPMTIYLNAFEYGKFGKAASTAIIASFISMVFAIIYLKKSDPVRE